MDNSEETELIETVLEDTLDAMELAMKSENIPSDKRNKIRDTVTNSISNQY